MPISMRCPGCQTRFDFADDLDGKRIKCKSCGDIFRVADPDAAKRARDEDDRRRKTDDDDRKTGRYGRPVDDDRRTGRYRKPDEDDRPRSRRRDDDSADDLPRPRRDDEDDRPRKKTNLLLILLPLALLGVVGLGIIGYFAFKQAKKNRGGPEAGDVVVAPSRSCPLEVPEKDVGTLVLPDGGTTFGLLRKTEAFKKSWVFEPYDVAAKRRVGKLDLPDLDDPKAWSLSPDGKQLLITEARGLGWAGDQWLWVFGLDGRKVTQDKWFPYTRDDKKPFDAPALHRAEFVANDKILTLATNRSYYIYPLPSFDAAAGAVAAVDKDGLGKHARPPHDYEYRFQWEAAFTADRKKMAIWTGDVYSIIGTADGVEASRTTSCRQIARDLWGRKNGDPERVKAGPVAFSPDGSVLAGVDPAGLRPAAGPVPVGHQGRQPGGQVRDPGEPVERRGQHPLVGEPVHRHPRVAGGRDGDRRQDRIAPPATHGSDVRQVRVQPGR